MRAINVACSGYVVYIRTKSVISFQAASAERDPFNRLIVKPIRDQEERIIAVAGMVLDTDWFTKEVAPKAIQQNLAKFFPADHQDAIVTLRGGDDKMIFCTQPGMDAQSEAKLRFDFGFWHYTVGVRMRSLTIEEWVRRQYLFNLSLSLIGTLVLIGGLIMGLRVASREMKLSQMKTDFVANVSHELRTPLSSIRVFGELLELGRIKEPERVREYGHYVHTEGRKLTQLINNILDFSRIESGRKQYQFERARGGG
jgi:signal transduction histidine kinase